LTVRRMVAGVVHWNWASGVCVRVVVVGGFLEAAGGLAWRMGESAEARCRTLPPLMCQIVRHQRM
jgi:hypothetical protein